MLCSKVWKIENDQRRLTLVDAARLAAAIGCDVEDFLPGRVPAALTRQE